MNKIFSLGVLGLSMCAVGCSGATDVVGSDEGKQAAVASAATVSVSGTVLTADGRPLGEVMICERQDSPDPGLCTVSTGTGEWKLTHVPANQTTSLMFTTPTFAPMLRSLTLGSTDVVLPAAHGGMVPLDQLACNLDCSEGSTTGQIQFFVDGASDVTASAISLDGAPAQTGYTDANGKLIAGALSGSNGVVADAPAGDYLLTFHSPSSTCSAIDASGTPTNLYNMGDGAEIVVPIMPSYVTAPIVVHCTTITKE